MTSDSSPSAPTNSAYLSLPSPHRSLSPILQAESAAERGSDLSGLGNIRDSYYDAVYEADDSCLHEVSLLTLCFLLNIAFVLSNIECVTSAG